MVSHIKLYWPLISVKLAFFCDITTKNCRWHDFLHTTQQSLLVRAIVSLSSTLQWSSLFIINIKVTGYQIRYFKGTMHCICYVVKLFKFLMVHMIFGLRKSHVTFLTQQQCHPDILILEGQSMFVYLRTHQSRVKHISKWIAMMHWLVTCLSILPVQLLAVTTTYLKHIAAPALHCYRKPGHHITFDHC